MVLLGGNRTAISTIRVLNFQYRIDNSLSLVGGGGVPGCGKG